MILKFDTSGDGIVSLAEFDAAVDRVLAAIDTDHDGRISIEESDAAQKEVRALDNLYRDWLQTLVRANREREP